MDRRTLVAGAGTAAAIALLALAASSGPVQVWSNPDSEDAAAPPPARPTVATTEVPVDTVSPDESVGAPWGGSLLAYVGVAVLLLAVVLIVRSSTAGRFRSRRRGRHRHRRLHHGLPEIDEADLVVDAAAADGALATGAPRNAIVACWMQLERDTTAAGLERLPAETSVEFVERVVGASSVDPEPIRELARLYREARFSRHDMAEADRERARSVLRQVIESVRAGVRETV